MKFPSSPLYRPDVISGQRDSTTTTRPCPRQMLGMICNKLTRRPWNTARGADRYGRADPDNYHTIFRVNRKMKMNLLLIIMQTTSGGRWGAKCSGALLGWERTNAQIPTLRLLPVAVRGAMRLLRSGCFVSSSSPRQICK